MLKRAVLKRAMLIRAMLKRTLSLALLGALAVAPMTFAQDDAGKDEATGKAEDKGKAEKDELRRIVQGAQEGVDKILDDMSENMRQIEELLEKRDTGASTQSRQKKVLDQLDELIEQASKT